MTKEEAKEDTKQAPSLWGGADSKLVLFMYNGGMSGMSISRALRIPYSRVLLWLKQEGVELRKKATPTEE